MQLPYFLVLFCGSGRLIRTSEDRGRVVILDPRIITKGCGKRLRKVLPHQGRVVEGR